MNIIELRVLKGCVLKDVSIKDYRLYYGLDGIVSIKGIAELKRGDAVVFNPNEQHALDCRKGIVACLDIRYSQVLRLTDYHRKVIVCNTCLLKNENSLALNKAVESLLKAKNEGSYANLLFEKYSLELLLLLVGKYSSNVFSTMDERKEEIEAYIESHYFDDLALPEIANVFGLTPPYFSKYFKENFGTTFLKYLNGIRIRNASEDLLRSDETALRIALNNGFPNVASLIREFKNAYGMTPNEYRNKHRVIVEEAEEVDLAGLLEESNVEEEHSKYVVDIDGEIVGALDKYWTNIVNLSSFTTVAKSGVLEQIELLQKDIGFQKARLALDTFDGNGKHDFFVADRVMEFFIDHHMDVIIVLDYRVNGGSYLPYLKEQCLRFVRRFGTSVQSHTIFGVLYNTEFDAAKIQGYQLFCDEVRKIL